MGKPGQTRAEQRQIRNALKSLPYLVHTNRELGLMLQGVKPMAKFSWFEGHCPEVLERYLRRFDRRVEKGDLLSQLFTEATSGPDLLEVFYVLPSEAWRIEAMRQLMRLPGPWTAEREREEGRLLGYTDAQNDWWLANRYGKGILVP